MRYLLYCIFHSPTWTSFRAAGRRDNQKPETLLGVDGQPVFMVDKNGLSAAISRITYENLTPDISRIRVYEKVIESFHQDNAVRGVIPMRYGCLFEEETQVIQLLKERCKQYEAILKELEGCVEMGIRILISDFGFMMLTLTSPFPESSICACQPLSLQAMAGGFNPYSTSPGRAYLAARKSHYAQQERLTKKVSEVIEGCRAAFAGLFVKCKTESSLFLNPQTIIYNPMLALYFLVPRRSIESFREVFWHMSFKESAKLLLSGPWPPYNFVLPDHPQNQNLLRVSG